MDLFWKQFGESDTDFGNNFKHNVFFRARLNLTLLYVLIVALIVLGFSLFLYQNIGHNLKDARDDDFAGAVPRQHFVDNTLESIQYEIFVADLFILITTAGLSFVLAGKTLEPIQRGVEAQKAFAANASHELRTPLAVIRNDIEVFLRSSAKTKEIAEKMMRSNLEEVTRMSGIVEDLLLLARSDNQTPFQHKKVDLGLVVRHAVNNMSSLSGRSGIQMTYEGGDAIFIQGIQSQLERVILNILQNSVDHTKPGGSITVSLGVKKRSSGVLLSVVDTGSGITSKDLPHIFTRFYKGNSAKGTGLGLAIVKEIVHEHGGKITVKSIENKGTTVTILMPLA
jgi:two-component system sensor histidine kinase CiaH